MDRASSVGRGRDRGADRGDRRQSQLVCRPRCGGDQDRRRPVDWGRARPGGAGAHHRSLPARLSQSSDRPGQGERRAHLSDIGDDARPDAAYEAAKSRDRPSDRPSRGGVVSVPAHAKIAVGVAEIDLYRTETANYRDNLDSGAPMLWVALRPTGVEPPYEIFAVTADPAEGEAWTEAGSDLVDVVPMPEAVRAAVDAFVAEHPVEQPFHKRERDRADPEALARRGPLQKERE